MNPDLEKSLSAYRTMMEANVVMGEDQGAPVLVVYVATSEVPVMVYAPNPDGWTEAIRQIGAIAPIRAMAGGFDANGATVDPSLAHLVETAHMPDLIVAYHLEDGMYEVATQNYDRVGDIIVWGLVEQHERIAGTVADRLDGICHAAWGKVMGA